MNVYIQAHHRPPHPIHSPNQIYMGKLQSFTFLLLMTLLQESSFDMVF